MDGCTLVFAHFAPACGADASFINDGVIRPQPLNQHVEIKRSAVATVWPSAIRHYALTACLEFRERRHVYPLPSTRL